MLADAIGFTVGYLALGLLTCWLARAGWPDEWDEVLLASIVGPPVVALVAIVFAADVVRARLQVVVAILTRRATAGR